MSVQFGESLTGDFEERSWTFEMPEDFSVKAGEFAIVPKAEYDALIEKPSFTGELILTLESKRAWVNRVPQCLPEKTKAQQLIWIDANNNCLTIGEDFAAAEEMKSYPVRVYRVYRVAEAAEKVKNQTKEQ
jgi:hypothetical protein